ncbi:DNA-binding transcriptional LysR family regulator [Scopulibacillus darangshiensis]|uniref:DNA-binding transcriptional LysR family regulator n=1 Tax=Scopulibacillus darangshiensis TaxID=442528 RepID=A0A4R2NXW9_9BACL|nr:LysR family transcriptional regulator [Scopulibacillus darangshiensis]TCP27083.1 DNA-binding transcriptional LysR family regulator [Scopulibacillus darangshiensis]
MTLEALKTFITVVEEQNFTRAGEKLLLSQPSVSLHIKNLENTFQTKLVDRSPKFLRITPTGQMLYERAKQMLRLYSKTKEEIYAYHHRITGTLKIGASYTIGEYLLPLLLTDFNKEYPDIQLEVIIDNTEKIVQSVKLLQNDIGLIEGHTNEKDLDISPFMEDEMVIVAPTQHVLASKSKVMIDDLQDQTWVTREKGSGTGEFMAHFIRSFGIRTNNLISFSTNQAVKEAVTNGMGISILSLWVVKKAVEQGELAIIHMEEKLFTRMFSYVLSTSIEHNKATNVFIDMLNNPPEQV